MPIKTHLELGETPWDDLSREELLWELSRYFSALTSAASCLRVARVSDPKLSYWGEFGSGGQALARADEAMRGIPDEASYRAYFRYANNVLFESNAAKGHGWEVCISCGEMSARPGGPPLEICRCGGEMNPLTWEDLVARGFKPPPHHVGKGKIKDDLRGAY